MTVQPTFSRRFTRKLMTACLAACLVPIALPMMPAIAAPGYKPPSRKAAQRTEGTGRRNRPANCDKDLAVPLTWLMPTATADSLPETTLERPPLFVYLAKPKTLSITLLEHPALGSPIKAITLKWRYSQAVEQPGVIRLPYPQDKPPLEIGKTYSLQMEIDCGADQPEGKRYTRWTESILSRVEAPQSLQMKVESATSPRQRAEIYAAAGLWTETLESTMGNAQDASAKEDLLGLLEQVGLTRIANVERKNSAQLKPSPVIKPSPVVTPSPTEKKKDCDHQ